MATNKDAEEVGFDATDLRFVGPATAAVLADAPFDAAGIADRTVSYQMLLDAGVNPGVATKIRRHHSLHWSFGDTGEADLTQRSKTVRGLRAGEREWIEASQNGWERTQPDANAETDGSGAAAEAEAAWRDRSRPTPVTDVPGVDSKAAELLAEAGITSARSLASADLEHIGDVLDLDIEHVASWCVAAKDFDE